MSPARLVMRMFTTLFLLGGIVALSTHRSSLSPVDFASRDAAISGDGAVRTLIVPATNGAEFVRLRAHR